MELLTNLAEMLDKGGDNTIAPPGGPEFKGRSLTADVYSSRLQQQHKQPIQKYLNLTGYRHISLTEYRMLGKKGEGSFAEVMACQSLTDGQLYACKRLKRLFVSVEQALALTEVRALRRINPHINIVQLHDIIFDKKSGRLALVFELMDLNLYELLKARRKPLPEFRVKNYMYQLLKALEHIHRHGIFHRDVKPENLLIRDNLLKLADFGSCRGIHTKKPYTEYISTRWYRPPECLLTSGYYSSKMDMWAAGCVFFEALTNLPLFPGNSELDQISKIHNILGTPKQALLNKLRRHKRSGRQDFNFETKPGLGLRVLSSLASDEAHDLLSVLVAYDEEDRLTAKLALRHYYFKDMRLAEKYHMDRGPSITSLSGKRSASGSKQTSPSSSKSDSIQRGDSLQRSDSLQRASPERSVESRKKHRREQNLLLPVLEVNGANLCQDTGSRSSLIGSPKCNTNRSVNFPPIEKKLARRKMRRNLCRIGNVSHLPPIQQPWRP